MARKRTLKDSALFADCISWLLQAGVAVRFRANGESMNPAIRDGEVVQIAPVHPYTRNTLPSTVDTIRRKFPETNGIEIERDARVRSGEVVLAFGPAGFKVHRVHSVRPDRNLYITRGDSVQIEDTPVGIEQIMGRVISIDRHGFGQRLARRIVARIRKVRSKLLKLKWLQSTPEAWLRAL